MALSTPEIQARTGGHGSGVAKRKSQVLYVLPGQSCHDVRNILMLLPSLDAEGTLVTVTPRVHMVVLRDAAHHDLTRSGMHHTSDQALNPGGLATIACVTLAEVVTLGRTAAGYTHCQQVTTFFHHSNVIPATTYLFHLASLKLLREGRSPPTTFPRAEAPHTAPPPSSSFRPALGDASNERPSTAHLLDRPSWRETNQHWLRRGWVHRAERPTPPKSLSTDRHSREMVLICAEIQPWTGSSNLDGSKSGNNMGLLG
mmetsp:Transcript_10896/g.23269  ORF Transcript_10896/g.23269 Transcript_10896/m.23269 type:complete len:257 (-) Transcript_10896:900-1670(-)